MKKGLFMLAVALFTFAGTASAQRKGNGEWREKMRSEKIAFITSEMELTPEEAQLFWPVYNEICEERDRAMKEVFRTFKALKGTVDEGKQVTGLLDEYLEALEAQREVESEAAERYRKVLDDEKLAKLYVSEEKFRRQHIRRMHHKPGEGDSGQPGQRRGGPECR